MTSQPNARPLADLRILVVEDMLHIAWEMCDELRSAGAAIVGPTGRLDEAVELAGREAIDAAVLDVALNGHSAGPVAEALRHRNAPFVLVSGYGAGELPQPMVGAPLLTKPVAYPRLIETLANLASPGDG